jgi:hypothetical protein
VYYAKAEMPIALACPASAKDFFYLTKSKLRPFLPPDEKGSGCHYNSKGGSREKQQNNGGPIGIHQRVE